MRSQTISLNHGQLSGEDISELNSAYFSLRVALIFLIVTVIIFVIMQLIKLIWQIIKIRNEAEETFDSKTPELVVHFKKSKRVKRPKNLLPSKDMKIQLSLRNESETPVKCEVASKNKGRKKKELPSAQNEVQTGTNIVSYNGTQTFSDELPSPGIKDSLALFAPQDTSVSTLIAIKKKPTFSALKAQDSLMVINNQIPLQPSDSAEKTNQKNKSTFLATKAQDSEDDKSTFVAAEAQDSLMVVNDLKPLRPSASAEQTSLEKTEKPKTDRQEEIEL
ncbi:unnamed protein product [Cercopithifilaria johnstoni]|uniref:Uncharacterized protein n=1 Tax=Cercopithifilaria johnstoni TaxID=2874296 RepID=A0A8J2M977_9BILA|nr:unnamed protein product [Cercopithifilaria johnstoni]